jgi:sterol desaturase/sphingolipid hydroxylase (fatty acid hydroxylase superfamily)
MNFTIHQFEAFLFFLKNILPYVFLGLFVIEAGYFLLESKKYWKKEMAVNLMTSVISISFQYVIKYFLFSNLYPKVYEHRLFNISLGWQQVLATLLIYGFLQWFIHLISHKVRFFWCLHEVHHSATEMNVTTGLRTSIFDQVSLELLYLLIPLFGFHYVFYFLFYFINRIWGAFIHVNERLVGQIPVLKYILVTPAAHQIHHARNIPYLDKNYGELIPWFDFIFKTYKEQNHGPIQYGTTKVQVPLGFWEAQTHEFKQLWSDMRSTQSWRNKFAYLWMPPGWHPGNFENTTRVLQKKYATEKY